MMYSRDYAFSVRPTPPTWRKVETPRSEYYAVKRAGAVNLDIARRVEGTRNFDFQNKRVFAVSAVEIGTFMVTPPGEQISLKRQVRNEDGTWSTVKTLTVMPMADMAGVTLTLELPEDAPGDAWSVDITNAEYFVVKALMGESLKHITGWRTALEPPDEMPEWLVSSDDEEAM